jgi:hypothetical protein
MIGLLAAKRRPTRVILIQQASPSDTHTRQRIVRRFGQAGAARFNAISRRGYGSRRLGRALLPGARTALIRVLTTKLLLGQLDLFHLFLLHGRSRQCLLRQPFGLLGCDIEKFFVFWCCRLAFSIDA